jgi:glycosyltransferase involved in cell wall biosynthesis
VNICLDVRTAQGHFPGVGRYTANLARALIPSLAEAERLVLLSGGVPPFDIIPAGGSRTRVVNAPLSPFSLRQQWAVPRVLRAVAADLYHSPFYLMPFRPGVPTVVTIYDLIPFRYPRDYTPTQRLIFAITARLAVRAAQVVIAPSTSTAHDLECFLGLPADRIAVTAAAAAPAFRPQGTATIAAVRARLKLPEHYVLYVGSNKRHKNLVRLVEAWARLQPQALSLIIAGVWDPRYMEARRRAAALALGDAIRFLGSVPEDALPALYSGATLFVFPSLCEGFGLPVIEAMACGVPVACSATSSLIEVAGQHAVLFDPLDVDAMADTIREILHDAERRETLGRRSLERAAQFSWDETARHTLGVYRRVIA